MKRNAFIRMAIAATAVMAMPFKGHSRQDKKKRIEKGFMVASGKDRADKSLSLFEGDTFYTKVDPNDTAGDIYVFESSRLTNGGPPLHFHPDQDEWWYVLQGEFLVKIGDQTWHAKAGDSIYGPRNVPHAFAKVGEGEGKLLMFFQPAGKMQDYFKAVSAGVTAGMNNEERKKFCKAHGFEIIGPALDHLKR